MNGWWADPQVQEVLAIVLVALVAGLALYGRWRRRRRHHTGCNSCSDAGYCPIERQNTRR